MVSFDQTSVDMLEASGPSAAQKPDSSFPVVTLRLLGPRAKSGDAKVIAQAQSPELEAFYAVRLAVRLPLRPQKESLGELFCDYDTVSFRLVLAAPVPRVSP